MKVTKKIILITSSSTFFLILSVVCFLLFINGGICSSNNNEMIQNNIVVNKENRTFYIHLPLNYKKEKKYPLVLLFHGTVANANKIKNYTKFNEFADEKEIIIVYPEYTGNWDWDLKSPEKTKEVKYITAVINYMEKNFNIDKKRIYQTGYSSGAEMSYILACSIPDKIAAFAPVAGNIRKTYVQGCYAKKPTPIMIIHGTEDPYEKWNGNPAKEMLSVDDTLNFWKKRNGCSDKQEESDFSQKADNNSTKAKMYLNSNCKDNTEVSLLKIEGGGHTWPGASTSERIETFLGKTNYDINANDIIWDFFSRHSLK